MKRKRTTTDVLAILWHRYYEGKPERIAELEEARAKDEIVRKIYNLRTKARLSRTELAKLVGTSPSVIARVEEADYEGPSLAMLRRIARALNRRVEVRFLPLSK